MWTDLDNITRFNNTQNAVKISDFRSNDPVQRSLAARFSKLARAGKQYWYKNKRTEKRDLKKIPIGMEDFTKTIHAFRFGPADSFDGTKYLFDTAPEGGYCKVYGDPKALLSEEDFFLLAGTWFVCDRAREVHKELRPEFIALEEAAGNVDRPVAKGALERRWMIFFVVGELLREKYRRSSHDLNRDLGSLYRPKWLDDDSGPASALAEYTRAACEILIRTYRSAARDPQFTHRYWFKTKDTLRELRTEVGLTQSTIQHLSLLKGNE